MSKPYLTDVAAVGNHLVARTGWGVTLRFNERLLQISSECCLAPLSFLSTAPTCYACGVRADLGPLPISPAVQEGHEQAALEALAGTGADVLTAVVIASAVGDELRMARAAQYGMKGEAGGEGPWRS